jgi:hypothetical protein
LAWFLLAAARLSALCSGLVNNKFFPWALITFEIGRLLQHLFLALLATLFVYLARWHTITRLAKLPD